MALQRYFRLALEEEFGQLPEIPEWQNYDISNSDINPPDEQYSTFDSAAHRGNIYAAPADYLATGNFTIPADTIGTGYILYGALGQVNTMEEGNQYSHEFTPFRALPTFQVKIGKDTFEHIFEGVALDSLTIEFSDNFLVLSADVQGGKDSKDELAELAVSDLPERVYVDVQGTFSRGGDDITAKIGELTLDINNNLSDDIIPAAQRYPTMAHPEGLDISIDLDILFEDEAELQEFWGTMNGPNEEVEDTDLEFAFEMPGTDEELIIEIPAAVIQSHSSDITNSQIIEESITYDALVDRAEGYPILVELLNDKEWYDIEYVEVSLTSLTGDGEVEVTYLGDTEVFNTEGDRVTVQRGAEVTFTAVPDTGWELEDWLEDASGETEVTFTAEITEDYDVGVSFSTEE